MAETATKLPVTSEEKPVLRTSGFLSAFDALRSEIDNLFDDFLPSSWRSERRPFGRSLSSFAEWPIAPAIDVVEKDDCFELTAEVPGLDEKNIEVQLGNGLLTIRGEKEEEKEESRKDYHMSERQYGSFRRTVQIPLGVDNEKVEATFSKGVLKVTLPKDGEARKDARKIEIKSA